MSNKNGEPEGWMWLLWQLIKAIALSPLIFKWGLAFSVLVFPPIYLAYRPSEFTPLVDTLLSVFMFLLAYWIGYSTEIEAAKKAANDRWLPQAESVILRLMTLHANVCRMSMSTKTSCSRTRQDLPELEQQNMRAVRMKLQSECEASGNRLDDIGFQLEDAIDDWRRFVAANCTGEECARIFDALEQRQATLLPQAGCGSQYSATEYPPNSVTVSQATPERSGEI